MKVSTRIRYGVRIIARIAYHYGSGKVLSLQYIGSQERMSEKYISQIIVPLKSAGLIQSFRGVSGGYMLSRDPKDISLREIISALDGNIDFAYPGSQKNTDEIASAHVMKELWKEINQTIADKLESIRLSDIVTRMDRIENTKKEPIYYI